MERRVACRLRAFKMRKSRDIAQRALLICLLMILAHSPLSAEEIRFSGVERLVKDVDFPVALCQFDKDTMLFTEKDGAVRYNRCEIPSRRLSLLFIKGRDIQGCY